MNRVRAGLTGLGAVFLLTLGVSLTYGRLAHDPSAVEKTGKEHGEPLAQLGVAPGAEKPAPSNDQRADDRVPSSAERPLSGSDSAAGATGNENPVQAVRPPVEFHAVPAA